MLRATISGLTEQVNDNSPFIDTVVRLKIEKSLSKLKEYGEFRYPSISSHVGYDTYCIQIRKHLNDVIGLDCHLDVPQHIITSISLTLGKGKKNVGNNTLKVTCWVSVPSNSTSQVCPYKVLYNKFDDHNSLGETKLSFTIPAFTDPNSDMIWDIASKLFDDGIQRVRNKWTQMNADKLERDIDLMDFCDSIKSVFDKRDIKVSVKLENELSSVECHIGLEEKQDDVAYIRMEMTDGRWHIAATGYEFDYVNEVFELTGAYHHHSRILPGKVIPLFEMIADEFVRQREVRRKFAAVRENYVEVVES